MSWEDGYEIEKLRVRLRAAEEQLAAHREVLSLLADGCWADAQDALRASQRQSVERGPK